MPQTVSYTITERECSCLVFQGDWNSAAAYAVDDLVLHNAATWICLVDNSNSEPTTINSNWAVFSGTPTP